MKIRIVDFSYTDTSVIKLFRPAAFVKLLLTSAS